MRFWEKVLVSVKRTLKTLENIFPSLDERVTQAPHAWCRPLSELPRLDAPQECSRRNTQFVCCCICNLTSEGEEKLQQVKCVRKPAYKTDFGAVLAHSAPTDAPSKPTLTFTAWPRTHLCTVEVFAIVSQCITVKIVSLCIKACWPTPLPPTLTAQFSGHLTATFCTICSVRENII